MRYAFPRSVLLLAFFSSPLQGQEASKEKAEAIFLSSCGTCHTSEHRLPFVPESGVDWELIEDNAALIVEVLEAKKMPPPRAPAAARITDEQRADLIAYVSTLIPMVKPKPELPLETLSMPLGFSIEVFADAPGARSLAVHETSVVFVGTGSATAESGPRDTVYAIVPGVAGSAPKVLSFITSLDSPNGVALHGNDLYVAESTRVIRFTDAVATAMDMAKNPQAQAPSYTVIKDDFVRQEEHYWKYLGIGPDEKLYVPIGANCNVCLAEDRTTTAGIFRMNLDGSGFEQVAKGVRNTVGFDWHPETNDLWFTDNGRDLLGDEIPSDELNRLEASGGDFGFPYCFAKTIVDPAFVSFFSCNEPQFTKPVVELGAHVAALGLTFYEGDLFPALYKNQIFVAEHGSWNRTEKSGYRVRAILEGRGIPSQKSYSDNAFISGWLDEATQINWGRPVDVKNYTDGSILISDDYAGVVYRVTYTAP